MSAKDATLTTRPDPDFLRYGNVSLVKDKVKIITQLINANDEHIWSKEYEENAENIIKVQNDVAEEVIKQLKITLSPNE